MLKFNIKIFVIVDLSSILWNHVFVLNVLAEKLSGANFSTNCIKNITNTTNLLILE